MVYTNPVPAEFATGKYYAGEAAKYYLSPAKLESDYAESRFERELRIFHKHCTNGRVLDVGCSSGAFLYQLSKQFAGAYEVVGTDASGPALDYAEKQGIPIVRGDFLGLDSSGKQFDAVIFWAVLEHVVDPGAFLDKAASLLNAKGLCCVLVPNLRSLAMRILGDRYRYVYPQHVNYFSRTTLQQLVRNRFEIAEVRFTHFNPIIIWQDWRHGNREVSNEERGKLLRRTTAYKQNPLLKPLKVLYRLTEAVLGRFGLADNVLMILRRRAIS